jgi:hypothetical protein
MHAAVLLEDADDWWLEAFEELAFELLAAELLVAPEVDELRELSDPELELDSVLDPDGDPPVLPPPAEPTDDETAAVPSVELPE